MEEHLDENGSLFASLIEPIGMVGNGGPLYVGLIAKVLGHQRLRPNYGQHGQSKTAYQK
jgi:hypothetical protein